MGPGLSQGHTGGQERGGEVPHREPLAEDRRRAGRMESAEVGTVSWWVRDALQRWRLFLHLPPPQSHRDQVESRGSGFRLSVGEPGSAN